MNDESRPVRVRRPSSTRLLRATDSRQQPCNSRRPDTAVLGEISPGLVSRQPDVVEPQACVPNTTKVELLRSDGGVQSNRRHPQRGMASGSRSRCKEPGMEYTTGTEEHIHLRLALPEEKYECRQLMSNARASCWCSPGGRSSGFKPGQRSGTPAALWREPHLELGIGRAPPGPAWCWPTAAGTEARPSLQQPCRSSDPSRLLAVTSPHFQKAATINPPSCSLINCCFSPEAVHHRSITPLQPAPFAKLKHEHGKLCPDLAQNTRHKPLTQCHGLCRSSHFGEDPASHFNIHRATTNRRYLAGWDGDRSALVCLSVGEFQRRCADDVLKRAAGGGAYYFAKRSIDADRRARLEDQRRKKSMVDSLEHSNNVPSRPLSSATMGGSSSSGGEPRTDTAGSPSQESSHDPAPTRHAPTTEGQRVVEKSKYESSVPYSSRKGDRFS